MAISTVMKMNGPVTGAVMIAVTNAVMNAAIRSLLFVIALGNHFHKLFKVFAAAADKVKKYGLGKLIFC